MCAGSRKTNNDVKPDHLTAGGHLGSKRQGSLLRTAIEFESEWRRCLELSLSVRASGATEGAVAAGDADIESRRVGGVAAAEAAAKACDVGWRSRKMKEEEEEGGVTTESSFWHQLQRGQEGGGASRWKPTNRQERSEARNIWLASAPPGARVVTCRHGGFGRVLM